ncbi:uncharacterized protein LOC123269634 [Cotesia glomerata]|uniref:uncharacterized protein LOC123269634 n=1 Tax=Cotesia glomerata TaxID=32391 RepID=UPI001D002410|nr:uncharacterized protein LOC123269634 [Cotesia glomerata]
MITAKIWLGKASLMTEWLFVVNTLPTNNTWRDITLVSSRTLVVPIKSKSAGDVRNAMKSVIQQARKPKNLHVDSGKEFYNKELKDLMKKYKIDMDSTFSYLKESICERFNRTFKNIMWQQFTLRGTYEWVYILDDLVTYYYNTKHRTIKMKPVDVSTSNEQVILRTVYKPLQTNNLKLKENKFKEGNKVRISKYKHVFE